MSLYNNLAFRSEKSCAEKNVNSGGNNTPTSLMASRLVNKAMELYFEIARGGEYNIIHACAKCKSANS